MKRRGNLLDFYDSYFLWVDFAIRVSDIILGHHKNPNTLRDSINNIKAANNNVLKFYTRLLIYIEDKEFLSRLTNIYNSTILIHNSVVNFLITLEGTSIRHIKIKDNLQKFRTSKMVRKWEDEHTEIVEKRNRAFEVFFKENEEFKKSLDDNKKLLINIFKKLIIN